MLSTKQESTDWSEMILLKADEVARRLSLGRATVYLMMASGALPTVRIGRAVRVPAKRLDHWIESQTQIRGTR